jgi:hypothetical protein
MDVEELLARAWGAVEKAGIPEPLQEYAFREALSRLSASAAPSNRAAITDGAPVAASDPVDNSSTSADADGAFGKFAHESGVSVEDLERVFYFADGVPHLNGPRSRFGRNASDQAKVVAVAITAAYDFVRDESPISDDVIKAETTRLKIDVGGNWARVMGSLSGASWIGAARQKQFKTTNSTSDALKKIVSGILGTPAAAE